MASMDGLCIGRAHHHGNLTPGSIRDNVCTLTCEDEVYEKRDFQVLCGTHVSWVKSYEGSVPLHALPAGETNRGVALFIGRVLHDGIYYIGKIHPYDQVCYVALGGEEVRYVEYETLVIQENYEEYVGR